MAAGGYLIEVRSERDAFLVDGAWGYHVAIPRGVEETLPEFADVFPFESFTEMQRAAAPAILETNKNVVVSAPTASGKTVLAELSICRTLNAGGTALFIAPLRALTNEKEAEWERFVELGYSVYVVTGERDLNPRRAEHADILVMTPEKVDSATRKHESLRYSFITDIDCCVIDEVHLLDSDQRGAVLEVTVSRLRRLCDPRVIALSATMPNAGDIAAWLDAPPQCTFQFDAEYRPVPLMASVETYSHGENAFADKYRRLYRALDLAHPHLGDDGQALIFVATRQDTVRAATAAQTEVAERDLELDTRGDYAVHTAAQELDNSTLQDAVLSGIGFHHAGLSKADKDQVEAWFKAGTIKLLFSTSTLAWGVNLPARCVVIRDTKRHDPLEGDVEMSPLDILQMLGRAGRPGYDDTGYAYVVCDGSDASRYRGLLEDGKPIDSRLGAHLDAHLNAEIALGSITSIDDVMTWLKTTFYYTRAEATTGDPGGESGESVRSAMTAALERLIDDGFVTKSSGTIQSTQLGQLTSSFYLRLPTAKQFRDFCTAARDGQPIADEDVLAVIATAAEFDSVSARRAEQDACSAVLTTDATAFDPGATKVLAILQAEMTGAMPEELKSDAWIIRQNALRLLAALRVFCEEFARPRHANLVRRIEARLEYGVDDEFVDLTAIECIGRGRAQQLANDGICSPSDVHSLECSDLMDAGVTRKVAEHILDQADGIPAVTFEWNGLHDCIQTGENRMGEVTIRNGNDGVTAGIHLTVNGVEMTHKTRYLGETTVPVGIFGADVDELTYTIEVSFPTLPIHPVTDTTTVSVE